MHHSIDEGTRVLISLLNIVLLLLALLMMILCACLGTPFTWDANRFSIDLMSCDIPESTLIANLRDMVNNQTLSDVTFIGETDPRGVLPAMVVTACCLPDCAYS